MPDEKLVTDYELEGPERGADRAVLLAHGAGADMHAATLTTVSAALAAAGVPALRFNFRYRSAGRNAPDRAPVLLAAVREAAAELARRTKLDPDRLVLGGRSMGGRMASIAVADVDDPLPALGLVLLGYPLHPAGKPDNLRTEHFPRMRVPSLFVSGTRDSLAPRDSLLREIPQIPGPVTVHWLESADHGFKPLKVSGLTQADVLVDAAAAVVDFVGALPGPSR
ncbi:MAG: alpha/beta hydrolase superfamily enzyme predicted hydrolase [Actinomycetia bacterium]|nr:alpha/beta hydrolase superfamily enzyme predicted hydrolase [Actinomycetes bacterium]